MKYITVLVYIILFSACSTTKNSSLTPNNTKTNKTDSNLNNVFIEYSAITRGSFLEIKIENQTILVKSEQYGIDKIKAISKPEWDILIAELHAVNLDSLSTLKAPSMKRAYDGAASARLQIIADNLKYSTPEFDHKNPNSEIKPLVEYILSLAEKVE